jgi:radical SAM-linked protein
MQRLRIKFNRGEELKFISHLDIIRLWQRAFNRAGIQIAYSTGFSPHPKISLAAPLPLGVTSEAELMDVYIVKGVAPHFFVSAVNQELPKGLEIDKVHPMSFDLPSLQSLVSFAEYRVEVNTEEGPQDIQEALDKMLQQETIPWQHMRDTGPHHYDLRKLINDLWVEDWKPPVGHIGMRLQCDSNGSGRPEQVAAALGYKNRPDSIHRTLLILKVKK